MGWGLQMTDASAIWLPRFEILLLGQLISYLSMVKHPHNSGRHVFCSVW